MVGFELLCSIGRMSNTPGITGIRVARVDMHQRASLSELLLYRENRVMGRARI